MSLLNFQKSQTERLISFCHTQHMSIDKMTYQTFKSYLSSLEHFHSKLTKDVIQEMYHNKEYCTRIVGQCNLFLCGLCNFDEIEMCSPIGISNANYLVFGEDANINLLDSDYNKNYL